jgi:hypothetical protein
MRARLSLVATTLFPSLVVFASAGFQWGGL